MAIQAFAHVDPTTGTVELQIDLPNSVFAEGLAGAGGALYQLTWRANFGYVRSLADLTESSTFNYQGEGWGLCHDGSSVLSFRDPTTFDENSTVQATSNGTPVDNLNELECVGTLVYANVWLTDTILRIDATTGEVLTEIDASGLLTAQEAANADVLNGIAYAPSTETFFLTGKQWPKLFEVEFPFDPDGDPGGTGTDGGTDPGTSSSGGPSSDSGPSSSSGTSSGHATGSGSTTGATTESSSKESSSTATSSLGSDGPPTGTTDDPDDDGGQTGTQTDPAGCSCTATSHFEGSGYLLWGLPLVARRRRARCPTTS